MLWFMAVSELSRAIAVAAFVASYVGLALGRVPGFRIDRTVVAIIGAAVMVASGAVPWPDAVAAVDAPTLVLLFGMMIVTAYLRLSGFFAAQFFVYGVQLPFLSVWLYWRGLDPAEIGIVTAVPLFVARGT